MRHGFGKYKFQNGARYYESVLIETNWSAFKK
jgi:hypothetical protein